MIKPEKVFDNKKGTGVSKKFNAQWYPNVVALIKREGGKEHQVELQGSMDVEFTISETLDSTGRTKLVKPIGEWYPFYRLVIIKNDGVITAFIGAGGA